jgi:hypothetical protein
MFYTLNRSKKNSRGSFIGLLIAFVFDIEYDQVSNKSFNLDIHLQ